MTKPSFSDVFHAIIEIAILIASLFGITKGNAEIFIDAFKSVILPVKPDAWRLVILCRDWLPSFENILSFEAYTAGARLR